MALSKNDNRLIVRLIITGTLIVSVLLLGLLLVHDVMTGNGLRLRSLVLAGVIAYAMIAYWVYHKKHILASSWMIIALYLFIMGTMLLSWGINAPMSILSVAFVILLPGILFGPKAIIIVSIGVGLIIGIVQILHGLDFLQPNISEINTRATTWDAIAYIIIFSIFGLLSWLSSSRTRATLKRANIAENSIREQRDIIRLELEEEYARARHNRLIEIERLYKFATLGQSTAATIHELSNHLSVLNMDINDLTQQHKNSKAITRAKESIDHINAMLRRIRRRLTIAQESDDLFLVRDATQTAIQDARKKFQQRNVLLETDLSPSIDSVTLHGDSLSWSHIITILVSNALEACQDLVQPKVLIQANISNNFLVVHVFDNGVGIPPKQQNDLFQPVYSKKPNGMGVGLYITRHIIKSQFHGTIKYTFIGPKTLNQSPYESGSKFTIRIPLNEKDNNKNG